MPRAEFRRSWFLYLTTLWMILWGILRIRETVAHSDTYTSAGITPPPAYFIATGAVFALLGFVSLGALIFHSKGPGITFIIVAVWFAWSWFDFLILHTNPLTRINWPYQLTLTLVTLLLSGWQTFRHWRSPHEI